MPIIDKPPALAGRFFAKVLAFVCVCPRCGQLVESRVPPRPGRSLRQQLTQRPPKRRSSRRGAYNPYNGRLTCPRCTRQFGVGLVLYAVPLNGGTGTPEPAPDQWPNKAEVQAMIDYSAGMLALRREQPGDARNLAIRAACTCGVHTEPGCPVHGYDARLARETAAWQHEYGIEDPPEEEER